MRLFPLQYAQASGELWFAPRLEVTLTLTPLGGSPPPVVSLPAYARERVAAFVDNPAVLADGRFARSPEPRDSGERCEYLLVTRQALLPAFQPLLDSKIQIGLMARAETIERIQSGQPGRDLPEKLRNYIRYACTNWGVQYVLLGGDAATVPCRYAYVRMNETEVDSYLPCDLYYACLDGSWNRDGDRRWGEPTDGEDGGDVDLLAEVWVGRAPADTPGEAECFVEKTLRQEREADSHGRAVLVSAEYLGRYSPNIEAQGGNMFEPLLPRLGSGSIRWLDDRPHTTPQWSNSQAIAALNESPRFVLYNGHGYSDTMMRLRRADLDGLTNARPFLVYSVGCHAGHFDNDQFSPDSIAEELIKRDRYGAFAAIFNPRLGWFDPHAEWKFSGEFQIKFFESLVGRGKLPLGAANHASKHDMLGHVENTGIMPYRWCCYEITLFGDPHTPVYLDSPASGGSS